MVDNVHWDVHWTSMDIYRIQYVHWEAPLRLTTE